MKTEPTTFDLACRTIVEGLQGSEQITLSSKTEISGLVWSGTEWKMPWKPRYAVGDKVRIHNKGEVLTVAKVPGNVIGYYRLSNAPETDGWDECSLYPATLDDPALLESIEHWTRLATGRRHKDEEPKGSQCALCKAYQNTGEQLCQHCPVQKATGKPLCHRTPFEAAASAKSFGLDSPQFLTAAQKELDFLISLKVENQGKKVDAWVPKFKIGDEVMVENTRRIVVGIPREQRYQTKNAGGIMFFVDECDMSPTPFNLHAHVRKSFPTLTEDVKFHREDWSEGMLPEGWRPCLLNERIVADCEWKDEHDPKAKWLPDPDVIGRAAAHWNYRRTRRPLPTPPKLVPLTAEDWMKDGPWWVRPLDQGREPQMYTGTNICPKGHMSTYERTNDGITWTKCGKVVEL